MSRDEDELDADVEGTGVFSRASSKCASSDVALLTCCVSMCGVLIDLLREDSVEKMWTDFVGLLGANGRCNGWWGL